MKQHNLSVKQRNFGVNDLSITLGVIERIRIQANVNQISYYYENPLGNRFLVFLFYIFELQERNAFE